MNPNTYCTPCEKNFELAHRRNSPVLDSVVTFRLSPWSTCVITWRSGSMRFAPTRTQWLSIDHRDRSRRIYIRRLRNESLTTMQFLSILLFAVGLVHAAGLHPGPHCKYTLNSYGRKQGPDGSEESILFRGTMLRFSKKTLKKLVFLKSLQSKAVKQFGPDYRLELRLLCKIPRGWTCLHLETSEKDVVINRLHHGQVASKNGGLELWVEWIVEMNQPRNYQT